ncbi:hypothetical protein J6590_086429 [Homalodisca vitripennis]|nr:hypothetical protein J6590_086429 [Homalodisca vitripennis]
MLEILSSQPTPAQCYSSLQCWRYSVPSLHLHSATLACNAGDTQFPAYTSQCYLVAMLILSSQPTPAQCYSSLQCWRYSVPSLHLHIPSLHLHSATLACNAGDTQFPAYTCTVQIQIAMLEILSSQPTPAQCYSSLQCWRYSVPSLHLHSATLACNAGDTQFPAYTCTVLL